MVELDGDPGDYVVIEQLFLIFHCHYLIIEFTKLTLN